MKLHHNPASPYVRKVRIALAETGLADRVELLPAAGHPTDPGTMPIGVNPLGKLPTLEREDGPALYDSRVICRYVDDRAGGKLYPAAPKLWETLTLEATADGILDAAVLMVYEARSRPEEKRDADWLEGQWAKIARAIDMLESRWMAYLRGPFDMAHAAVACALGYLDFRHSTRDWRSGHPELTAWYDAILARDSVAATMPEG